MYNDRDGCPYCNCASCPTRMDCEGCETKVCIGEYLAQHGYCEPCFAKTRLRRKEPV